jgi:hypothetical protein
MIHASKVRAEFGSFPRSGNASSRWSGPDPSSVLTACLQSHRQCARLFREKRAIARALVDCLPD